MDPASKLSSAPHTAYVFSGFTLDVDRAALIYAGVNVRLRPQSFDVLRYLVEHHGRLVTKNELLRNIWGNTAVTDDSLTHCLIDIRKAIGDSSKQMIKTVSRRGFIFDMPVESAAVSARLPDVQQYPYSLWKLAASIVIVFGLAFAVMGGADRSTKALLAEAPASVIEQVKAEQRYVQGWFLFQRRQVGDLDTAERYFQRAVDLQPDDALMLSVFAGRYAAQGLMDKAIKMQTRAVALGPLSRVNIGNLAYYLFVAGRYDEAQAQFERGRQIFPELADEYEVMDVFASILLHQYEDALAGMESLVPGPDKDEAMGMVYHALGREREARQVTESMMLSPDLDPDTCIRLAELHAFRQNIDDSFIWLEELRQQLDQDLNPSMVYSLVLRVRQSPFLATVRADPRWEPWLTVTRQILM